MPNTTIKQFPSNTILSVQALFDAAFNTPRNPRSAEYKIGARIALEHRIERRDITILYPAGTAQADAFFAGVAEGYSLWRRAGGAAAALVGGVA